MSTRLISSIGALTSVKYSNCIAAWLINMSKAETAIRPLDFASVRNIVSIGLYITSKTACPSLKSSVGIIETVARPVL
jgi:hypothetical protein